MSYETQLDKIGYFFLVFGYQDSFLYVMICVSHGDENIHKVLLILRHAKSSWKDKKVDDHDRPLNNRGRREAIKMGEH